MKNYFIEGIDRRRIPDASYWAPHVTIAIDRHCKRYKIDDDTGEYTYLYVSEDVTPRVWVKYKINRVVSYNIEKATESIK